MGGIVYYAVLLLSMKKLNIYYTIVYYQYLSTLLKDILMEPDDEDRTISRDSHQDLRDYLRSERYNDEEDELND